MFSNFNSFRSQLRKKIVNKLHSKNIKFTNVQFRHQQSPTKTSKVKRSGSKTFLTSNNFSSKLYSSSLTEVKNSKNYFSAQLNQFQQMKSKKFNIKSFSLNQ